MKLTNRQKAAFALLAVAVAALVVDRLYFTPASAAAQSPLARAVASAAPVVRVPSAVGSMAAPTLGLISDQLKSITTPDLSDLPDAFEPSHSWVASQQPTAAAPTDHSAADFVATHKLSAVLESENGGVAIVDGQLLRVGQRLGEFALTAVGSRWAEFTKNGTSVRLTMAP